MVTHWIVLAVECRSTASVRIASVGYAKLTMESVAARGIALLYPLAQQGAVRARRT